MIYFPENVQFVNATSNNSIRCLDYLWETLEMSRSTSYKFVQDVSKSNDTKDISTVLDSISQTTGEMEELLLKVTKLIGMHDSLIKRQ